MKGLVGNVMISCQKCYFVSTIHARITLNCLAHSTHFCLHFGNSFPSTPTPKIFQHKVHSSVSHHGKIMTRSVSINQIGFVSVESIKRGNHTREWADMMFVFLVSCLGRHYPMTAIIFMTFWA